MHARRDPVENVFRYPVYMTLLDLDELPLLDRSLRLFGWNRRAATSFHDRDHLDVRAHLAAAGIDLGPGGRIQVLTNLRVLGHVFNPVSFWWCFRSDGELACVVAEVNNTFGDRLPYLLLRSEAEPETDGRHVWETDKRIHVSPFMPLDQSYTWWLSEPGPRIAIRMDVHQEEMPDFHATLVVRRIPLTSRSLQAALVRYPLMPLTVLARIHWQAVKLRLRGVPFFRRPPMVPGKGSVH